LQDAALDLIAQPGRIRNRTAILRCHKTFGLHTTGPRIDLDLGDQCYVAVIALIGNASDATSGRDLAASPVGLWRRPGIPFRCLRHGFHHVDEPRLAKMA
jgi:hypothetical protein